MPSIAISATNAQAGSTVQVTVTGTGTTFTANAGGQWTASGTSGSQVTAQVISSDTLAVLTVTIGAAGVLTIANAISAPGLSATFNVHYSSQQRLIDRYGAPLVAQACGGTIDAALIDRKLTIADGQINARYSGTIFIVPLVTAANGVPVLIADVADRIAFEALYHARGVNDRPAKPKGGVELENKFSMELAEAYRTIAMTLTYPWMLADAVRITDGSVSLALVNL